MIKMTNLSKQIVLGALVLAVILAAFPISAASAAPLNGPTTPPTTQPDNSRLEKIWAREQAVYQREGERLAKASAFIAKVQTLIDKANGKGWNTSAVQAALDALSAVIPAVQSAHEPGAAIISSHAGFDADGKVTDRTTAIQTAKSLARVLKDTRTAMNGTGKALREAIKALREAHPRPTPETTP